MSWVPLLLFPILFVFTLLALSRQATREGDRFLFALLAIALIVKLAGAVARYYVAFDIYEGQADATRYHKWGVMLSERFRNGDFDTGLSSLTGTNFIKFFTGVIYTVIGPWRLGAFLFCSWLGFWGLFLFYRAFVTAVPEGRRRSYAILVFFLPSLVFWPSSVGKEAWMMFTLGIAAFGAAQLLSGKTITGFFVTGGGLWLAAIVRPHIAGLMALGLVAAYVVRRPREELGAIAPVVKGIAVIALAGAAFVLVGQAEQFLQDQGIATEGGVSETLASTTERTSKGGSEFVPSILDSPLRAPVAVITVLFRPLIVEAHNTQQLAAGAEATFLFLLFVFRIRWIVAAFRSLRRQPYVMFALAYSALLIVALSSFANFGILARERVQLFPLFLVLLCVPPRAAVRRPAFARATTESSADPA